MTATGPNICGTGADDSAVGSSMWSVPSNITATDGTSAGCTGGGSSVSHYLKATNFGFSLANDQQIDGIVVTIRRKYSSNSPTDSEVKIVKGGTVGSTNRSTGAAWSSSMSDDNFGGGADLWGESWTYSDINSSSFGVALSVTLAAGMTISEVDSVSITVYHSTIADAFKPWFTSQQCNQFTSPSMGCF